MKTPYLNKMTEQILIHKDDPERIKAILALVGLEVTMDSMIRSECIDYSEEIDAKTNGQPS